MKSKFFSAAVLATLLGIYSASVYQFSLDTLETGAVLRTNAPPILSLDDRESDKQRILDVVQVREFVTVESNLPVPGANCEFSMGDVKSISEEEVNNNLSVCLENAYLFE